MWTDTGPQYIKYNAVLRGAAESSVPFMRQQYEQACLGNTYASTLHTISAAVARLSKVTPAEKVESAGANHTPRAHGSPAHSVPQSAHR